MSKSLTFDVVIPTKNEEVNIKLLLNDISKQTYQPSSIIVADKSKDNTAKIAKEFGCKIVEGVDDGYIGKGRNRGIAVSQSDLIIFLDADVRIENTNFFKEVINEFILKKYDVATCLFKSDKDGIYMNFLFSIYNSIKKLGQRINHVISDAGSFIIAKRNIIEEIGGFDEDIKNNEDILFLNRFIKNKYTFGVINNYIITSTRRFSNKKLLPLLGVFIAAFLITILYKLRVKKNSKIVSDLEKMYGETGGTTQD